LHEIHENPEDSVSKPGDGIFLHFISTALPINSRQLFASYKVFPFKNGILENCPG
jgi:hypothetical protein